MTILTKVEQIRRKIMVYNSHINQCTTTTAGCNLKEELKEDRNKAYYELGKLCSNSGVKICLQSEFTR